MQVFVSGIPYECTDDEFKEFFAEIAENITQIKLPRYQDSGRCMGYGHITLNSFEAKEKALKLGGGRLKGRYLDIKDAQGSKYV